MFRRAMTLMEVATGCIVLGVSASLACVSMAEMKRDAGASSNLANIGSTIADFFVYADESQGKMPNFGLPSDPAADWFYNDPAMITPNGDIAKAMLYASIAVDWPRLLTRRFGAERPHWHSDDGPFIPDMPAPLPPGASLVGPFPSRFKYSLTLVTAPTMWTWPGRVGLRFDALTSEFEVVRQDSVTHPSRKGVLLFDRDEDQSRWLVGFADGAASERKPSDGIPAAQPVFHPTVGRGRAVMSTINGYLGVDF